MAKITSHDAEGTSLARDVCERYTWGQGGRGAYVSSQIEPGCPDDLEISDAEMMADVARADATWPDPAPEQDEPAVLQLVADIAEADPGADPAEAGELLREALALALRLLEHLGEQDIGAENHGGNGQAGALVQLVADRLEVGRHEYGPLRVADDPRDWPREAMEELADAVVYLAAEVMRTHRATRENNNATHGA